MVKLAIVGIFFDGYEDMWYDFVNLFHKNWPDCPYPLYIVDNTAELDPHKVDAAKVTVLHAGKDAEYSRKVQVAVNQIDAEYYLLLLEDFFVVKPVSNGKIQGVLDFIQRENIEYYTMPMPEFVNNKETVCYGDRKDVFRITTGKEYLMSCQPSVWKRDFLNLCIGRENYNAWIFEGIYAKTPCVRNEEFLKKSVIDYSNVLQLRHGALQGKMLPATLKEIHACGHTMHSKREVLSAKQRAVHKLKQFAHRVFEVVPMPSFLKKQAKKHSVLEKYADSILEVGQKVITEEAVKEYITGREQ